MAPENEALETESKFTMAHSNYKMSKYYSFYGACIKMNSQDACFDPCHSFCSTQVGSFHQYDLRKRFVNITFSSTTCAIQSKEVSIK